MSVVPQRRGRYSLTAWPIWLTVSQRGSNLALRRVRVEKAALLSLCDEAPSDIGDVIEYLIGRCDALLASLVN